MFPSKRISLLGATTSLSAIPCRSMQIDFPDTRHPLDRRLFNDTALRKLSVLAGHGDGRQRWSGLSWYRPQETRPGSPEDRLRGSLYVENQPDKRTAHLIPILRAPTDFLRRIGIERI